jgi:predicted GNAT family N-acyltransferase
MIKLAVAIRDPETRKHFQELLALAIPRIGSRPSATPIDVVELCNEADTLIEYLRSYLEQGSGRMAVLISDWLVSPDGSRRESTLVKQCHATFAENALGLVAIMLHPRRVADVDRAVTPNCGDRLLEQILGLIIDRLVYLAVPATRTQVDRTSITVRPLRTTNETEFQEYFMLRHQVYTIMGYLDDEVVSSRSRLEVNEADLHAIHLGAFYRQGACEKLVGTARVVTNNKADGALYDLFSAMIDKDPVAKQRLNTPYSLGLPIFQSYRGMNDIIFEVFTGDEICGELSRVIVAPDFRGNGISQDIIDEALDKSIHAGAQRLFLECLPVHEALYEKHGFKRIPGVEGPVVDVGRTMIAMQMGMDAIQQRRAHARQMRLAAGM